MTDTTSEFDYTHNLSKFKVYQNNISMLQKVLISKQFESGVVHIAHSMGMTKKGHKWK